jgi:phosphatidylglycerophosphate synthase
MSAEAALPLKAWSRWNAVAMLVAAAAAVATGRPWPVAAVALPSIALLVFACRRGWTPRGGFGAANAVTALRFALVAGAGLALHRANGWLYCALVQLVFALDGIDGWLARRRREESAFGSHFDMETDAVLVLVLGLELWQRERLGAWAVVPGLLRYLYVLSLSVFPARRGDVPRSTLGRRAFVALMIGLPLALIEPGLAGTLAAVLGSALVVLSFALSFRWSYGG